jgi:hypothetical protein
VCADWFDQMVRGWGRWEGVRRVYGKMLNVVRWGVEGCSMEEVWVCADWFDQIVHAWGRWEGVRRVCGEMLNVVRGGVEWC